MSFLDAVRQPYEEMDGDLADADAVDALKTVLLGLGDQGLADRQRLVDAYFNRQGITFSLAGKERPLPLDLVPRLLSAAEWRVIEQGVAQRIRALEMFLADVYGPRGVLDDGIVPRRLITSSKHYHREAWGSNLRTPCASTWPASTSSVTSRVSSQSLRTICAARPA